MPNAESLSNIAQGQLAQKVDDARTVTDRFKLPAWLRTQLNTDLATLETADANTAVAEGDRVGGSAKGRVALDKLADLLREGYNFITAIRTTLITDAQRLEIYTEYGWASGNLGRFTDARVIGLSRLALQAHDHLQALWRYPADLLADITAQLGVYDANAEIATGGDRSAATLARDNALEASGTTLAQVRFFFCSASRDIDQTPELSKIGFQPRRAAGAVAGPAKPGPSPSPAPTPPVK